MPSGLYARLSELQARVFEPEAVQEASSPPAIPSGQLSRFIYHIARKIPIDRKQNRMGFYVFLLTADNRRLSQTRLPASLSVFSFT
jgi:hypothetical protein